MKSLEKEKMCVSCEGRIDLEAEVCPYCGTDQSKTKSAFQAPLFQNQSLEDSLTSLYTPPYSGRRPQFGQQQEESTSHDERPPMTIYNESPIYKEVTERPDMDPLLGATARDEEASPPNSFLPTLFLAIGANFLLLGLLQLFFSKNGILRLEWNANYWFFYCLIGGPLLYFGFKKLRAFNE